MPASPRFPRKRNVQLSDEQMAWAEARAEQRGGTSFSAVVRELIQAAMDAEACLHCPIHCQHEGVQP